MIGGVIGFSLCLFVPLPWWFCLLWLMTWAKAWHDIQNVNRCLAITVGYFKEGEWRWLDDPQNTEVFGITGRWLTPFCLILQTTDPRQPYWWIWRDACDENTFRQLSLWSRYE